MRLLLLVVSTALISSVATFFALNSDLIQSFSKQPDQSELTRSELEESPAQSSSETLTRSFHRTAAAERVALIVANQYGRFPSVNGGEPETVQLSAPENDADAMRIALQQIGFSVEVALNVDSAALRKKINGFKVSASRAEHAVIYYTGTGVEIDGVNFFPSVDATGELSPEQREKWFTAEDFANAVKSARQKGIVMLDGGRPSLQASEDRIFKFLGGDRELELDRITNYSDVVFLYSSLSDQFAFEEQNFSYFAKAVSEKIVIPDITFHEFFDDVKSEIEGRTSVQQSPELVVSDSGSFVLFSSAEETGSSSALRNERSLPVVAPAYELSDQPRIALVIGVADYNLDGDLDDDRDSPAVQEEGFAPDLKNPTNDANDIASELSQIGFSTKVVINPDRTELENSLFEFGETIEQSGTDAISLIYFAGHGVQVQGTNYLVPAGARMPAINFARWPEARIERQLSGFATPIHILYERFLEPSATGVNLIILDACRNNPWENRRSGRSAGSSGGRGLADIPFRLRRSAVAFATMPGTEADDGKLDRNSPYTRALKQHIGADNLPIRELFDVVGQEVEDFTENSQTPFLNSSPIGEVCLGACVSNLTP